MSFRWHISRHLEPMEPIGQLEITTAPSLKAPAQNRSAMAEFGASRGEKMGPAH